MLILYIVSYVHIEYIYDERRTKTEINVHVYIVSVFWNRKNYNIHIYIYIHTYISWVINIYIANILEGKNNNY